MLLPGCDSPLPSAVPSPGLLEHVMQHTDSSRKSILELVPARAGGKSLGCVGGEYLLPSVCLGGAVPALGVCRSEARQSCGMMCVSCRGAGEAVAPVSCTCCPKRFPAYIIPVHEKLESLPPCPHKCERK